MKRILSFCMFLMLATLSHAEYQSMLSVGKQWNYVVMSHDWWNPDSSEDEYHLHVTSISDTVTINGLTYFVVNNIGTDDWYYRQAFMREDTMTQQVWIRPDSTAEEHLLFSFNVAVGDTLRDIVFLEDENDYLDMSQARYIVTDVERVDGRKRISLRAVIPYYGSLYGEDAPYEKYHTWIESIGERAGGLAGISVPDGRTGNSSITALLCVRQDDDVLFVTNYGDEYGCELEKLTAMEHISSDEMVCRYVNGQYIIFVPGQENILSVQVYDCRGAQLLPCGYTNNHLPSDLPANVYMLILKTNRKCYNSIIIVP